MKKVIYSVLCVAMIMLFACNSSKKAENLQDLVTKYSGKTFNNCKSYFPAYEEIMDVYFSTIDRAYEGSEEAWEEVEKFDDFFSSFVQNVDEDKIMEECPERFEAFEEQLATKMNDEYLPKLLEIITRELNINFNDYGDLEDMDFDVFEMEELIIEQ